MHRYLELMVPELQSVLTLADVCSPRWAGKACTRLDIENVENPNREFNNFGGNNPWPAPEGGMFGFNYPGGADWCVQPGINSEPYKVVSSSDDCIVIAKRLQLINRAGNVVDVEMRRAVELEALPQILIDAAPVSGLCYITRDSISVLNALTTADGLVACWTLEQFDASPCAVSFCAVQKPETAINFDFYKHPEERITCYPSGFTYKTDGACRGQIGIKTSAAPACIGFYDQTRKLLCIRENMNAGSGRYFNIADNDQPNGPFNASDNYSIFNSDADGNFFELETIGTMLENGNSIAGSSLVSMTAFATFDKAGLAEEIIGDLLSR